MTGHAVDGSSDEAVTAAALEGVPARRALLLSGSLGMGHDVMAQACAVTLERRGWTTDILDSLELLGRGGLGERVFRGLLTIPGVYDAFHFEQLRPGRRLAEFAERASSRYTVPALEAYLDNHPSELIVSVFATGAAAAGRVKQMRPELRLVVFCTDVCPHRLWIHDETDLYLVTSDTAKAFVRRFHPEAEIAVVPAPVRPPFYDAPTQLDARADLGIPADASCVLLMSGSWGLGPLVELARSLADAGVHTLAVAGRNTKLEMALRAMQQDHARLHAFGFTDAIPTLMAAADLVVTSSGDTCSEARVVGRHLLLLDVVPGHGRENLQQELERGGADVAPSDAAGLRRSVFSCLNRLTPPVQRVARTPDAWEAAFDAALARVGIADRQSRRT